MDPARDNQLIRFATFWWGLGTFMVFGILLAVIWWFNRQAPAALEDVVAKARYETKARIATAQAASLSPAAINAVIPAVAQQLAASKPAAVAVPEQVIPGSPTAAKVAPSATAAPVSSELRDLTLMNRFDYHGLYGLPRAGKSNPDNPFASRFQYHMPFFKSGVLANVDSSAIEATPAPEAVPVPKAPPVKKPAKPAAAKKKPPQSKR